MKKSYISNYDIDVVLIKDPTTTTGFKCTRLNSFKRQKHTFEALDSLLREMEFID